MKYYKINEIQLYEIINLIEDGYHVAYTDEGQDYLTICLTDDNGNMKDNEITDRFFDLMYAEEV